MKKVLTRTIIFVIIAVLVNYYTYYTASRRFHQEGIMVISVLSLLLAVPMVLGYVVSYSLSLQKHTILNIINWVLFLFNGIALIICTILSLVVLSEEIKLFFTLLYLIIGWYVYIEAVRLFTKHQKEVPLYSDSDVLDDNWL